MDKLEALMLAQYGDSLCLDLFEGNEPETEFQYEELELSESEEEEEASQEKEQSVKIVEFQETKETAKKATKKEFEAFMAADISKINEKPRPKSAQDQSDDEKDKELMDLLDATKLIEQYKRRDHIKAKISEVVPQKDKAPAYIRHGIARKRKKDEEKRIELEKESGMFVKKKKIEGSHGTKGRKVMERGLNGSVGKYKNGTLYVSKKDIESASSTPSQRKGSFGGAWKALSGERIGRKATKSAGKKKKKKF